MSTPADTALSVQQFLTKTSMIPMPHPPYPSDLTPEWIFFCSPGWKKVIKGKHFANVEDVPQKMAEALKGIKIDKFKNCSEQWKKHLNRGIASDVEHFEGDSSWNIRINIQFFMNKFWVFWVPSPICKSKHLEATENPTQEN